MLLIHQDHLNILPLPKWWGYCSGSAFFGQSFM